MITIFTDGSARGNPGPGGWGAIVVYNDTVLEMGGREDFTTNNRMELQAAISALEKIPVERRQPINVYTDSAYVASGTTRWMPAWQKNGWKTSQKEDVLNRDLWEKMTEVIKDKNIGWIILPGHSGILANERCDQIATSFADNKNPVLYFGSIERYGVSLSIPENNQIKAKSGRIYAYSYVSQVGGIINIHKTWEACKSHIHGVSGARFKKARSKQEEEEIVREFSKK